MPSPCSQPAGAELEGAFAATRYLSGLLSVARKHRMLRDAPAAAQQGAAAAAGQQQEREEQQQLEPAAAAERGGGGLQPASVPARGQVLVAHPALTGIFSRSVVLLCSHSMDSGSYGEAGQ